MTPSTLLSVAFSMRPLLYLAEKHIFVHYFLLKSKSSIFLLFNVSFLFLGGGSENSLKVVQGFNPGAIQERCSKERLLEQ